MGRKTFKNDDLVKIRATYMVHDVYARTCHPDTSLDHGEIASCEFRDYCNRLYYIDGKCSCIAGWKKTAGLALPTSV